MQKNIDDYFINKSKKDLPSINLKKYFYLSWTTKNKPDNDAYWTETKPDKINFIEKIDCSYIKKGFYFFIVGYFTDYEEKFIFRGSQNYNNIHFLKSHLQKSIRKKNGNLAVQTCFHLMKLDLNELLRRLPIIMLEDTTLHESITTIIWLMIANGVKTFKMKNYIYEWIMGFVYVLSEIPLKDSKKEEVDDNNILKKEELLYSYHQLERNVNNINYSNYISILYSLHIRIAYGGISGDMKMINNYAKIWHNRFRNDVENLELIRNSVRPISLLVRDLNLEDWDLSAIDYHCHPKFLEFIGKKYPEIQEVELRKLVWKNSSSINARTPKKIYNPELWNEIKEYVIKTQKYLLDSSY